MQFWTIFDPKIYQILSFIFTLPQIVALEFKYCEVIERYPFTKMYDLVLEIFPMTPLRTPFFFVGKNPILSSILIYGKDNSKF